MSGHFYDRTGKPVDVVQWGELRKRDGYLRIGFDKLESGFIVSTVWIGIDMGLGITPGPRGLFESAVFDGATMRWSQKYDTEQEALRGHRHLVIKWLTKLKTEPKGA